MSRHARTIRQLLAPLVAATLLGGPRPSAAQGPIAAAARTGPIARRADALRPPRLVRHVPDAARSSVLDTSATGDRTAGGVMSLLHPTTRQSVGLMAGGVAAVAAGALIKGNIGGALALGGATVAFHGLYHYLMRNDP